MENFVAWRTLARRTLDNLHPYKDNGSRACGVRTLVNERDLRDLPMTEQTETIGDIIRARLALLRISQNELARLVGVSRGHFSQILNGQKGISQKTLARVAIALRCQPGELLPNVNADAPKIPHVGFEASSPSRWIAEHSQDITPREMRVLSICVQRLAGRLPADEVDGLVEALFRSLRNG